METATMIGSSPRDALVLPRLAESVTEATVVAWLVEEGDVVAAGQPLVEVDADKFLMALEVEHDCVVERILHPEGARVEVGETLARLAPVPAGQEATPATEGPVQHAPPHPAPAAAAASADTSADAPASISAPAPASAEVTAPASAADDAQAAATASAASASAGTAAPRIAAAAADDFEHGWELEPLTPAGRRFCALVDAHAPAAAARAAECDREGRFPAETFREFRESGLAAACVPERFGGGGLDSLHDLAVGIGRMGRADASTAIALNMHLAAVWGMTRHWRAAGRAGNEAAAAGIERLLRETAAGRLIHSVAGSEPGTDILHPLTEARRDVLGWRVSGRKIFGTLSGEADLVHVTVRVPTGDGGWDIAMASFPRGTEGLQVMGDWNAMGMRASGSHTVELRDCFATDGMLRPHGRWGQWNATVLEAQVSGNIGLLGAYLGVAEAARALVLPALRTRRKAPSGATLAERPGIQQGVARMEVTLCAARASLQRAGLLADAFFRQPPGEAGLDVAHGLMKEFQCAKWLVNRRAIEVVDQAMTLSGGSGYAAPSPLARLYRDVRAGPFMQLFSPNEAFEYIGRVALGIHPEAG
jgi:alkylation response protein AidB-like acyl-CoA dehydrogenase